MMTSSYSSTSVTHTSSLVELASIFEPWCNITHLKRNIDSDLLAESKSLARETWDGFSIVLPGRGDADGVDGSALTAEFSRTFRREVPALQEDLLFLSELLRDLTGANSIGVRVMRLEKPACPNLHFDRVGLRLVTTYRGPGTEYVPDTWTGDDRCSSRNLRDHDGTGALQEPVISSRAGDILLLKGTLWEGNEQHGAIHRSPSFDPTEPRIVATLDPL